MTSISANLLSGSVLKAHFLWVTMLLVSVSIAPFNVSAAEFSNPTFGVGLNSTPTQIAQEIDILPVDDAFALQVLRSEGKVEVLWQIRPGHYLYKHRLGIEGSEKLGELRIPDGLAKHDEYFGDVEVYYEALIVEVPLASSKDESRDQHTAKQAEQITVHYQGCSDAGICYPPQKRQFIL